MRLAFCLFKYFPYGGLQRDFLDLALRRREAGDQVHVYVMEWQGERPAGLAIHTVGSQGLSNHARSRRYHRQASALIGQAGMDLVIGFNRMPGLDLHFAADLSYKARRHGPLTRLTSRYRHFTGFERAVFAPQSRTHILALTARQKAEYQQVWQTPDDRFTLLPPGISPEARAPDESLARAWRQRLRAEFGVGEGQHLLLFIASSFKTKGLDRALLALHALPPRLKAQARLVVVGQDKAAPFMRQLRALSLQAQVSFVQGRDDLPAIMQAGDLLLHPARVESAGKVLLEAVVAGLPVIVTDVCGFAPHVRQADAGLVLPSPFDQQGFNRQLAATLESTEQRQRWRQNGIRYGRTQDLYSMSAHASTVIGRLGSAPASGPAAS